MKRLLRAKNTFPAVLLFGLFAMAARNAVDPDLWWHLKTGQYIAEHKSVPHVDPFSFTRAGAHWVAHEWLAELFLYHAQRLVGWNGLILLFAAIISAAFFLLYLRCGPHSYIAGVFTVCGAFATITLWGVRPQILSLLLTSLWLLILERSEDNPKLLWWTLPLTLLWVNLHAGFALGLALSAVFLAGEWIEGSGIERASGGLNPNPAHLRLAALTLSLDLLLVSLNPNGPRLFFYPVETLRSTAMQNYIAEWASPNFHLVQYLPLLLLLLGTFVILGWKRSAIRLRDFVLLLVSLFASLVSVRLIPFFVLIAAPLLTRQLADSDSLRNRSWKISKQSSASATFHPFLNAVMILTMAGFAVIHTTRVIHRQPQAVAEAFPEGAVAFLQSHPITGPIFNHYDWGGYLIWKLYPATRVFIDGRADLYGESILDQFDATYQFKGDWPQPLQHWDIRTVLVPSDSALAAGLRSAPGWRVAYEDAQAVIFTLAPDFGRRLPWIPSKIPGEHFAGY
jgi:hypothetical protein